MIVLVKDIPAYAFSSGLNELVFATDQNKAVLSMTVGENIRRIRFERDAISKRRLQNMGQEDKYYIKNHHPAIVSEDIFDKA